MKKVSSKLDAMPEIANNEYYGAFAERVKQLSKILWKNFNLPQDDKALLVAGSLLALNQGDLLNTYQQQSQDELPQAWFNAVAAALESSSITNKYSSRLRHYFANIATLPALSTWGGAMQSDEQSPLHMLLSWLHENIQPLIRPEYHLDALSCIYMQMGLQERSKKLSGIVLTPPHICELFCEIANLKQNDTVLDLCAGSGALLFNANAKLIGVEQDEKMFALLAANALLSVNKDFTLIRGSCFDEDTLRKLKEREMQNKTRPNIGFLNPPYAQARIKSNPVLHELYFVKHMLDQLSPGGLGIAIVPMSCATLAHKAKHEILAYHTLKAVMSMPLEIFHPVNIGTCIMVFESHKPHVQDHQPTCFGYWREDGFVKTKDKGRVDMRKHWQTIKEGWLADYRSQVDKPGHCINAHVTVDDEWVAEAYLETDYSKLTQADFEKVVKSYALHKVLNEERHD